MILSLIYLFGILFPPWSEESGGLVWAHADDELTLRIPAQVLDCVKVTWYHNPRPPLSLVRTYCSGQFTTFQPLTYCAMENPRTADYDWQLHESGWL